MISYASRSWTSTLLAWRGTVLRRVLPMALGIALLAVGVVILREIGVYTLKLDPTPHTLIGVALGLLLVFRNNASYDRFWEGRKQWGAIVNHARSLVRCAAAFAGPAPDLARLVAAYARALKQHLRGEKELAELAPLLPAADLEAARSSDNPPLTIAFLLAERVQALASEGRVSQEIARTLEGYIASLTDAQGACERILRTPMPFGYVVHIRQLLTIYLLALPWVLVEKLGWVAIPTAGLIAFGLIGIEEIGVEIEDPFGTDPNDLPIDALCATIEANTAGLAALDASRRAGS